jgi:DNA-binding transcriptional regulator LsrR (DeoR family)
VTGYGRKNSAEEMQAMIEEVARLKNNFKLTNAQIARRLGYPTGTIAKYVKATREQGLIK